LLAHVLAQTTYGPEPSAPGSTRGALGGALGAGASAGDETAGSCGISTPPCPRRSGNGDCLQTGQAGVRRSSRPAGPVPRRRPLPRSHSSMHDLWKKCPQGSVRTTSPGTYTPKQTMHSELGVDSGESARRGLAAGGPSWVIVGRFSTAALSSASSAAATTLSCAAEATADASARRLRCRCINTAQISARQMTINMLRRPFRKPWLASAPAIRLCRAWVWPPVMHIVRRGLQRTSGGAGGVAGGAPPAISRWAELAPG